VRSRGSGPIVQGLTPLAPWPAPRHPITRVNWVHWVLFDMDNRGHRDPIRCLTIGV
jgi:hypothetical protein